MKTLKCLVFSIELIFFFVISISCSRSVEEYKAVSENISEKSTETSEGVQLYFSDFGKSKLKLEAQTLISSEKDNQITLECPNGLNLTFYDSLGNFESVLLADYGMLFTTKELLVVEKNVLFRNYLEDTLFAHELTIDFEKDSIYSKDQVTFSNKEGRISGKKLKANSNFTFFKLSDISDSHVNYEVKE
mgnify:CR=1 FL=1